MLEQEIKASLAKLETAFYQKYGIRLAYTFGSINTARFTPESDVDIAIMFDEKIAPMDRFRLTALFQLELRKRLQRKVDVTILNFAQTLLRYEVIRGGSVLYAASPDIAFLFESRAYRDYEDYRHYQRMHIAARERRVLGTTT